MLGEVSRRRVIFPSNIIKFKFSKWLKLQHFPGVQERENKNCGRPLCCSPSNLRSKWKTVCIQCVCHYLKILLFVVRARKWNLRRVKICFSNWAFLLQNIDVGGFTFLQGKKKSTFASNKQKLNMYERKLGTDRFVQLMLASAMMSEIVIRHMKYSELRFGTSCFI